VEDEDDVDWGFVVRTKPAYWHLVARRWVSRIPFTVLWAEGWVFMLHLVTNTITAGAFAWRHRSRLFNWGWFHRLFFWRSFGRRAVLGTVFFILGSIADAIPTATAR